jgi:hypothetical protein
LTKELVELHRGKIEVESEEGKGSTFRVSIPLGKEHLSPEEIVEKEESEDFEEEKLKPVYDEETERKVFIMSNYMRMNHSRYYSLLKITKM